MAAVRTSNAAMDVTKPLQHSNRFGRQSCLRRGQFRKSIEVDDSFPPTGRSQVWIIGVDNVVFTTTCYQKKRSVFASFLNRPELVDLIRIGFAAGCCLDVLSPTAGTNIVLVHPENYMIAQSESVASHFSILAEKRLRRKHSQNNTTRYDCLSTASSGNKRFSLQIWPENQGETPLLTND